MTRTIVDKGWGYEEIITNSEKYCAKILHLNKDKQLSWHYHKIKDETFYIENGSILLLYSMNDNIDTAYRITLGPGNYFHVPVGMRHRLFGIENSRVFEFSTQHFDKDSYRLIKGD